MSFPMQDSYEEESYRVPEWTLDCIGECMHNSCALAESCYHCDVCRCAAMAGTVGVTCLKPITLPFEYCVRCIVPPVKSISSLIFEQFKEKEF